MLRRSTVLGVGSLLALACLPAAAGPARPDPACAGPEIAADRLTAGAPLAACDPRGRIVRAGGLAVRVPHDGTAVTASGATAASGAVESLTVVVAGAVVRAYVAAPPPAGARPTVPAEPHAAGGAEPHAAGGAEPHTEAGAGRAAPRCTDDAGAWLGSRWFTPLRWRFNPATVPAYLGDPAGVRDAVRAAAENVDAGRNECGLPADLGVSQRYAGHTNRRAAVTPEAGCEARDEVNTVSFGPLAAGLLAVTCIWWRPGRAGSDGRTLEADILVRDAPGTFFRGAAPSGCADRWDLEAALTHEFGHVFGLGHVGGQHALTMSESLPPCSTAQRRLGLGDYAMLQAHYGPR